MQNILQTKKIYNLNNNKFFLKKYKYILYYTKFKL
jgi:hypothetical protein